MFDWLGSALGSIGSSIGGAVSSIGSSLGLTGPNGIISSLIPGLASGAGQYLSTSATNAANLALVQQQNQAALDRQREQENWEENLANTAEQRQVADLEKAGLNPILAAHGSGAAVPNVSPPPVAAGQVQNAMGGAIGTAISSASAFQDLKLRAAQVATQNAQTEATLAQARKANVDADSSVIDLASKQNIYGRSDGPFGSGFNQDWLNRQNQTSVSSDASIKAQFDARSAALESELLGRQRQTWDYLQPSLKAASDVSSSYAGQNVFPWLERILPFMSSSASSARNLGTIFGK